MKRRHQRWHLRIWIALAILLPGFLLITVLQRQDRPVEPPLQFGTGGTQ
ncbi:hypothetical protein [Nisaea nitritireducens]|nr:hypothetical protein [Nisaea nitritireducens]